MSLVSDVVRNKALAAGASAWVDGLPLLIAEIEVGWGIEVGECYLGGTEAFVARADLATGEPAVLKLMIPRPGDHAANEILVLEHADGRG